MSDSQTLPDFKKAFKVFKAKKLQVWKGGNKYLRASLPVTFLSQRQMW